MFAKQVELKAGAQSYPINVAAAEQFRIKAKLSTTSWAAVPVLRSVFAGSEKWVSASDWAKAKAPANIVTDYSQP